MTKGTIPKYKLNWKVVIDINKKRVVIPLVMLVLSLIHILYLKITEHLMCQAIRKPFILYEGGEVEKRTSPH